jgi:hypothetical protein
MLQQSDAAAMLEILAFSAGTATLIYKANE